MKKMKKRQNKNNHMKKILLTALMTTVALDQFELMDRITNNTKAQILDDVNGINTNQIANNNNIKNESEIEIKDTMLEEKENKNQIISKLSDNFMRLYGVSKEECFNLINENIDYIITKENPIEELDTLIQTNIVDKNIAIINEKENIFGSGTGNVQYVKEFKKSNKGKTYQKYADMYGVDINYALALAKQESNLNHESHLPGGNSFNGCAYGISQVENTLFNQKFTAYNFKTKKEETYQIVEDYPTQSEEGIIYLSVKNYDDNVRIGIAKLQSKLEKYNYNALMALQAYNYGDGSFNLVLNAYANETGKTIKEIINNKNDLGWKKYVLDLHQNPGKYIKNWQYNTYGDGRYINHTAQYFTEYTLKFETKENKTIYVNAHDLTTVEFSNKDLIELNNNINNINNLSIVSSNNQIMNVKTQSKVLSLRRK